MEGMSERKKGMEKEMDQIKTPVLTLDPKEHSFQDLFREPQLKEDEVSLEQEEEQGQSAGAVDESMLSEEEKMQVNEFVKQIDITDVKLVNSYGTGAQKGIATFSASITNIKTKEFGDVGESLRELRVAINSTVVPEKKDCLDYFRRENRRCRT